MHRLATFRTRPPHLLLLRPPLSIHRFARPRSFALHSKPARQHVFPLRPISTHPILIHSSLLSSLRVYFFGASIALSLFFGYVYITDTRSSIHLLVPSILKWVYEDAEDAHEAGNAWLRGLYAAGLHPRERNGGKLDGREADLTVEVFGHTLDNPLGTSAGIDKHAEIPDPLLSLGPAVIELGGATPNPQDGNPRPRVFRLPSQKGLVNRYGLNSEGADDMAMRLRKRVRAFAYKMGLGIDEEAEQVVLDGGAGVPGGSLTRGKLMAVQVAKNKWTDERDIEAVRADYVYCVEALARYADIIVVNVSSPNSPGLRTLQRSEPLTHILTGVVQAAHSCNRAIPPAVMVKVSPDEDSEDQVRGIADAVWASGVDGIIVGNTTKRRHDLLPADHNLPARETNVLLEQGGYSGPQLFSRTLELVGRYRRILDEESYMRGAGYKDSAASPLPAPPPALTTGEKTERKPDGQQEISATPEQTSEQDELASRIEATTTRDAKNLKPSTAEATAASQSQPLIRIPVRNNPLSPDSDSDPSPALSSNSHIDQLPPSPFPPSSTPSRSHPSPANPNPIPNRKIIFATGGITTGAQALEVLEAGASVAQIYTALVYGGVGTVTRMKTEMREEMRRRLGERNGEVDPRHVRQVKDYVSELRGGS